MRQEGRSRVDRADSPSAVDSTPCQDSWLATPGGSGDRVRPRSRKPGRLEGKSASRQLQSSTGKRKERGKMPAKAGVEEEEDDADDNGAVRRLHSVEKADTLLMPVLELIPDFPLENATSAEATYTSNVVPGTPREERGAIASIGSFSVGETFRELSTVGSDNGFTLLQMELAQEKRKNIFVEQRLLSLDKEIKELRAENARLVSAAAGNAVATTVVGPQKSLTGGDTVPNAGGGSGLTHVEQMVRELQDELDVMKEYTKELEARLADRSNALERRCREVEQKESRIRQLERTMADELIRRSNQELTEESAGRITSAPITAAAAAATDGGNPHSRNPDHKDGHHGGVGVPHEGPAKVRRERLIGSVAAVPSTVRRTTVLARLRPGQEHRVGGGAPEPLALKGPAPSLERTLSSDHPAAQEKPRQRASSLSQKKPHTSGGHAVMQASSAHDHDRSEAAHDEGQPQQPCARLASVPNKPRSASLLGRRSVTPTVLHSLKTRHRERTGVPASTPAHSLRHSRRESLSKSANTERRSLLKRNSTSPIPHVHHAGGPPHTHAAPRPGTTRPPPVETSIVSTSGMSTNASALHHMETRSVASTARSRPRISHNDGGNTVIQTNTTTVVTRSVKRRDSPVLVPQPRLDLVESFPSDQNFVSEKFSTTTYRPNRLVRYHNDDSNARSLSPRST
ncbi:hypothetical protein TraAM80_08509 [Trypanosoma rangeli]|uniref:Uncharacterized protein n=1 Tax=Trypanosoma rangeli TaxID=5698 RepID=A0A422N0A5_TRYRA|nr:uncharacterized protein TraAM80_08509 [Trypanosoma rangeli]RNE98890.1 hypothetical protein TraAM80_08509 [Trypanosoma rangeli]|eukprot:RNE98890.1 hypothetical protein TraAM80_08509 [Trypanosoma rangeli]